ncbi:MAG: hypothetical protein GY928_02155 [Colwellia sp.]|nr:hypothetical protein [Colwellia sp.]
MVEEAKEHLKNHIEMLYIQTISRVSLMKKYDFKIVIDEKSIESYLKKRGYTMNYVSDRMIMVKGFTCVFVKDDYVEVWHDKTNNDKSVFISESLLTGLPITLDYMERT